MESVELAAVQLRRFGDARDTQGEVAYVPALAGAFTSQWLDPRYWARNGALLGGLDSGAGVWLLRDGKRCLRLRHLLQPRLPAALRVDRFLWRGEARCGPLQQLSASQAARAAGLSAAPVIAVGWRRTGPFYRADVLSVSPEALPTLAQQLGSGRVSLEVWAAAGRCLRRHHDLGIHLPGLSLLQLQVGGSEGVVLGDYHRARLRSAGLWQAANLASLRRSMEAQADAAGQPVDEVAWNCLLAAYG